MNSPKNPARGRAPGAAPTEAKRLRDLSPQQWKSGIAAWLGWLFDGLDMHLYTIVATPFVATLLHVSSTKDPDVGKYSSIIQAAFLLGWALGGGFFGRVGDLLGRTRALSLTILTYALFTGLSFFSEQWWHLMIFRFMAALGIGGEWAVGASLLSETWPKRWRPWMAAVLQTGVNIGVVLATVTGTLLADQPHRYVFLVGILPALLVFWIRKSVPETREWHEAKHGAGSRPPPISDLFRGSVRRITQITLVTCAVTLTAHWAFLFWYQAHLRNLPDVIQMSDGDKNRLVNLALFLIMVASIFGNFLAAALARRVGYPRAIAFLSVAYFGLMFFTYFEERDYRTLLWLLPAIGACQGIFALFTMYLPPLFPTLLRTTGAGFCYNIGRMAAAVGTVFFGLFSKVGDYRLSLLYASFLFLPAAILAWRLPELRDAPTPSAPVE